MSLLLAPDASNNFAPVKTTLIVKKLHYMHATYNLSTTQFFKLPIKNEVKPEKKTADTAMLVQMIKAHSERAFTFLYDSYSTALYNELLKFVRRIEVAEDLLQDTYVKIWKNIEQFNPVRGTLYTWMLNIARNLAIDYLRSSTCKNQLQSINIETFILHENFPANTHSHSNDLDYKDFKKKALKIENKYAVVIDLICFQGYTQYQTSEILKLPLGTVKTRARKGLSILRHLYQQ